MKRVIYSETHKNKRLYFRPSPNTTVCCIMTNPKNLSINDYTYSLPEERIAKYPLAERDASKLLIYRKGKIDEDVYKNIAEHIAENSLLVFNNIKN